MTSAVGRSRSSARPSSMPTSKSSSGSPTREHDRGVLAHVADLAGVGLREDEHGLAVPPEPDRDDVRASRRDGPWTARRPAPLRGTGAPGRRRGSVVWSMRRSIGRDGRGATTDRGRVGHGRVTMPGARHPAGGVRRPVFARARRVSRPCRRPAVRRACLRGRAGHPHRPTAGTARAEDATEQSAEVGHALAGQAAGRLLAVRASACRRSAAGTRPAAAAASRCRSRSCSRASGRSPDRARSRAPPG